MEKLFLLGLKIVLNKNFQKGLQILIVYGWSLIVLKVIAKITARAGAVIRKIAAVSKFDQVINQPMILKL